MQELSLHDCYFLMVFFYHWNGKVPNVTPSYFHSIRLENVQQSLVFWTLAVHTEKKNCSPAVIVH